MKNDLSDEQLRQEVVVALPLKVVLELAERDGTQSPTAARLEELRKKRPALGSKGLYGIYAGVARGYNGEPDGILEVLDEAPKSMPWADAVKYAEGLGEGARLPTRKEQALCFANVPELFKEETYWSGEQHAGDSGYAWYQYFSNGLQDWNNEVIKLRVRAVRRVPL
jgi:hypothetical protein